MSLNRTRGFVSTCSGRVGVGVTIFTPSLCWIFCSKRDLKLSIVATSLTIITGSQEISCMSLEHQVSGI